VLIVGVTVGWLVDGLVWRRRSRGRSHPPCAGYRALAMSSAATCIEACETKEEKECNTDDNCKCYPATPGVPGGITAIITTIAG
jgi:hypothetical protein